MPLRVVRCYSALPAEMTGKIIDYCLYCDFSELPSEAFEEGGYELLDGLKDFNSYILNLMC